MRFGRIAADYCRLNNNSNNRLTRAISDITTITISVSNTYGSADSLP